LTLTIENTPNSIIDSSKIKDQYHKVFGNDNLDSITQKEIILDANIITFTFMQLFTEESGEKFSKVGEFFISVKSQDGDISNYPSKGHIKMAVGDTFIPPNSTTIYTGIHKNQAEYHFKIRVLEKDLLKNDTLLDVTIDVLNKFNKMFEINSSNNKVHLKIAATVESYPGEYIQTNDKFPVQNIQKINLNGTQNIINNNLIRNSKSTLSKSIITKTKESRYLVNIYLLQLYADKLGEYYFEINDQKYPNKGVIKLNQQYFIPGPNINIFSALQKEKDSQSGYQINIKVKEENTPKQKAELLNHKLSIELKKFIEQTIELLSDDKLIKVQIQIVLEEVENW